MTAPIITAAMRAGICKTPTCDFAVALTRIEAKDPALAQRLTTSATLAQRVTVTLLETGHDIAGIEQARKYGAKKPIETLAKSFGIEDPNPGAFAELEKECAALGVDPGAMATMLAKLKLPTSALAKLTR